MDLLRHLEEAIVAADDLPVCNQSQVVEDRHPRAQQLRHAAAVRGGIDMKHPGTSKIFRVSHEIIEHGVRRDASIRAQRTRADIDELEHRSLPNITERRAEWALRSPRG